MAGYDGDFLFDSGPQPSMIEVFMKKNVLSTGVLAKAELPGSLGAGAAQPAAAKGKAPARFTHACMTLPYRQFSFERALTGIKNAGYNHVAWGTTHGENVEILTGDAPAAKAAEVGRITRDHGLEPVQMFSRIYPDDEAGLETLTNRIKQASAAGIGRLLVFGPTTGGDPDLWVKRFGILGPIAKDHNVLLILKQHGGVTTGTGKAIAGIIDRVNHPNVLMSYDAGNVVWYLGEDPIADIQTCADKIRAFCIKDARTWPDKAICGPGYGEIDHHRLLAAVAFNAEPIVLTYENVYPPYANQADDPDKIDEYARQARNYVENVIRGLHSVLAS